MILKYEYLRGSPWKPKFAILDEFREKVLEICGPCCIFDGAGCCCDNNFRVNTSV